MAEKKIARIAGVNKLRQEESAQKLEIAMRRKRVQELILARVPHSQIAEALGISKGTVQNDRDAIMRDLAAATLENLGDMVLTSLAKLDLMETGLHNDAISGDRSAVSLTLRIDERRARITGTDAADRAKTGLQIVPPEDAIDVDSAEVLTPDGRPVANRDAARIYAAFASQDPEATGTGPEPKSDGSAAPPAG